MAQASYQVTNFLGGEWSQFAQGRTDKPTYRGAMNVCLNCFPMETGANVRRPGSLFLASTYLSQPARLIPFEFKQNAPYMCEFTNGALRFYAGAQLAATNDGQNILAISTANPPVVQTATAHGWSTNDMVEIINTNVYELQNRQFLITVVDTTHFAITDPLGFALNGATITAFQQGFAERVLVVPAPYQTSELTAIRSVQAETQSVLLHGAHPPEVLTATQLPTNAGFAEFTLAPVSFLDGPYLDPDGSTMTPTGTSGTITLGCSESLVNNGDGFSSADIGRLIRLFSEPKPWPGSGTGGAGDIVSYGDGYWIQQVNNATSSPGAIGPSTTAAGTAQILGIAQATSSTPQWLPLTVGAAAGWYWGTITGVTNTTTIQVVLTETLLWETVINTWRLGVFGGPNGYPTCGTYVDGRLWLAGAIANRVDCSNSNDIFNFAPTLGDGTVLDSSAIAAVFNSDGSNPIFWMEPDLQGIICGTQAGEWLVSTSTSTAGFSPTNIQARRVTKIGCAFMEPRRTEHTLIAVQTFERKLVEMFADVFSGKFTAPDITQDCKHLTIGNLQEIAYQQELAPIIWARVNDGLIGITYKRDALTTSQGPSIAGGHRHTLGSGRDIESIAVGGSDSGTIDALYMVTNDPVTGFRHVEVLSNILDEGANLQEAIYLDNAVRPTSILESTTSPPYGGLVLTGLFHLNGLKVTAWVAGLDCGDYKVANGEITVPYGDGISAGTASGQFTAEVVAAQGGIGLLLAVVGYTYTTQGQIVRPNAPAETGARNGPAFGKKRRHHQIAAQVEGTQGVSFGTSFSAQMYPATFLINDNVANPVSISESYTGIYVNTINDDYSYDGMLCWQVTRPYPCNMVAIGGFLETMDR